jgi:ABC-type arginine transport system permease subunit
MVDKRTAKFLLLALLAIGFSYRIALTTWSGFPPGADIGLHQSVINSILAPKTTFFFNYYHMGGGVSVTNPGYHIFTAFIITVTGATEYLAQAVVASLFSALIVLCAFMIVKLVWGELAGFVVAVLATFSASDIIMLGWAGYPNIVALALIPLLFYLFLLPEKFSQKQYIIVSSIITGALFLTHTFSGIVFCTIAIFALLVSTIFKKSTKISKNNALTWLTPIFFGFILVSPYLLSVLPIYFGSQGAITGTVSVMKQAVVETRSVPTLILGLAIIPIVLFLFFSQRKSGKIFTVPSVLFASAILVPLVAAQCYLLGFFLDYERFLYFLALPVIVCIGIVIVKAAEAIPIIMQRIKVKSPTQTKPLLIAAFAIVCLLTPLFSLPYNPISSSGFKQTDYFQVMDSNRYEAIKWLKDNSANDSVIASDAEYGWWISGFAERPTLSAVDPQYLILQREFAPAEVASNLLEADYSMNNGLLQIKQTGAYANGSVHNIFAVLDTSVIRPLVFSVNDTIVSLLYRENGLPKETKLGGFTDSDTQVANDGDSSSFIISRANSKYRVTEEITIYQGVRFAKVTFVFQNEGITNFDWLRIPFTARGELVQYANSVGIVDNTMHMVNQIVFPENHLGSDVLLEENPDAYELVFNLAGKSTTEISFYVGLYQYNAGGITNQSGFYKGLIENNTRNYMDVVSDQKIECFDYRTALQQWKISYVAVRDTEVIERFSSDSTFKVAYQNSEVTIFEVTKT